MSELVLPAFHLDCRDWVVVAPEEVGLSDEVDGPPVLAVLSTVVLDDGSFRPARGVLTVGVLDSEVPCRSLGACVARRIVDEAAGDCAEESRRYLMPAPEGELAVVADFALADDADGAIIDRVESLMRSFRWAA
ncbi:MAG: hypothetical protein EPN43_02840 [Jatrophihabitans sp.]|nr:MAG: hypothetical protein EPN43_02840 [Jatrophihabitans sp.]